MDPQINELKELIRQNIAVTQDIQRQVHAMRNAGRIKSALWWLLVLASIGLSVWSYYTFVEPRVAQIEDIYQTNIAPLGGVIQGAQNFLKAQQGASSTAQ